MRRAVLLMASAGMFCVAAGCRLPSGSTGDLTVSTPIQRTGLSDVRRENSGDRKADDTAVVHADATSEQPGEVEHAEGLTESDRPSRWSRLIDRLRPAKRMPLPLSPEDPEATLQEAMTAF